MTMHEMMALCKCMHFKGREHLHGDVHLLCRVGKSSRVEHKVCSNIFVILRLGGKLIVKINPFIISIFSSIHYQFPTIFANLCEIVIKFDKFIIYDYYIICVG
jgi:hypothetical protein